MVKLLLSSRFHGIKCHLKHIDLSHQTTTHFCFCIFYISQQTAQNGTNTHSQWNITQPTKLHLVNEFLLRSVIHWLENQPFIKTHIYIYIIQPKYMKSQYQSEHFYYFWGIVFFLFFFLHVPIYISDGDSIHLSSMKFQTLLLL